MPLELIEQDYTHRYVAPDDGESEIEIGTYLGKAGVALKQDDDHIVIANLDDFIKALQAYRKAVNS